MHHTLRRWEKIKGNENGQNLRVWPSSHRAEGGAVLVECVCEAGEDTTERGHRANTNNVCCCLSWSHFCAISL